MSDFGSEFHVQSSVLGHKSKSSPLSNAPGLFVGLNFKVSSDFDSIKSPTSPLELRVFSNLSNSPKSSHDGHRKSWDCSKVGLGIVDSLDDGKISAKVLGSSESKNIIFGPKIRTKTPNFQTESIFSQSPRSVPKNCSIFPRAQFKSPCGNSEVFFEIGDSFDSNPSKKSGACSFDSRRFTSTSSGVTDRSFCANVNPSMKNVITNGDSPRVIGKFPNSDIILLAESSIPASVAPVNEIIGSLSASEIELSEDYTCVISHGANPKTTHIYGDCILECHSNDSNNFVKNEVSEIGSPLSVRSLDIPFPYHPSDFLSCCYFCNKRLENGKDIYIYRGEKSFCSSICRYQEILIDEELEKSGCETSGNSLTFKDGEEHSETHGIIAE